MAHLVETMFSVRETPWHGLGNVIPEAPTSRDAIIAAGLDWNVVQSEVVVNGKIAPNYIANVRDSDDSVLGIVTERYSIVQNIEAFNFTDQLLGGGDIRYETAGSLRNGRTVWMLARMNQQYNILGDQIDPYMVFTNSHDGTGSIKVLMTPIRVVCNNTLNFALNSAKRQWSTIHVGDINKKIKAAEQTLFNAEKYMTELNKDANKLVDIKITPAIWKEVVEEIFPIEGSATNRKIKSVAERRQQLHDMIQVEDLKRFQGTAWAAMGAITDYASHATPGRNSSNFKENNFDRVIHGHHLVDKTRELLLKV